MRVAAITTGFATSVGSCVATRLSAVASRSSADADKASTGRAVAGCVGTRGGATGNRGDATAAVSVAGSELAAFGCVTPATRAATVAGVGPPDFAGNTARAAATVGVLETAGSAPAEADTAVLEPPDWAATVGAITVAGDAPVDDEAGIGTEVDPSSGVASVAVATVATAGAATAGAGADAAPRA